MGKQWKHWQTTFFGSKITEDGVCSHEIKRCLLLGRKFMTNLDSILKSRDNKGPSSQSYDFSSSHIWMWELDHKESWALKNWCFWTVVLEKTLESLLDNMEIKPVNPKGNLYCPWNSPGQNTGMCNLSLSQGSSQPRDWTHISPIAGRFFSSWPTREAQEYWSG